MGGWEGGDRSRRASKQSQSQPTGNRKLQQGLKQTDDKMIKVVPVWREDSREDRPSLRQGSRQEAWTEAVAMALKGGANTGAARSLVLSLGSSVTG